MNTLARNLVVTLILAIIVGACGYWFFSNFELREVETDAGYSREARENRYLAMSHFLRALGTEVENASGRELLDNLPPPSDTLFLSNSSSTLSMRRQQALRDWMEQGGHLITVVDSDWDEDAQRSTQPFFDQFGIQRHPYEANPSEDDAEWWQDEAAHYDQYLDVRFADYEHPVKVHPDHSAYLVDANSQAIARVADETGNILLQYNVGEGRLTVFTDVRFWENRHIDKHDHALFAWLLMDANASKVWIMYDISLPSLVSSAWAVAPYAMVASLALLCLWLWSLYNRFGPTLGSTSPVRRSLLEHLQASANFHWQNDRANTLLEQLQDIVKARLEKSHPGWSGLSPQQQTDWLAKRTQVDGDQLLPALTSKPTEERTFISCIRTLQLIHKNLS